MTTKVYQNMLLKVKRILLIFIPLFLVGCAKYQYRVIQPSQAEVGIVREKSPQTITLEPLDYRLIAIENRLVMEIHNPTEDPLQLRGDLSTVVTEDGQTHTMRTLPIAAHAQTRIILPPPPPTMERTGPSFTFGGGISSGGYRRYHNDYYWDDSRRYRYNDPNDPYFWNWPTPSTIHLRLVYDRAGKQFTDELVIERSKAK
jgi:hypothetical protein